MLRRLTIKNYALIEGLELDFSPGFTIITGETGAGKSIMLGALSLLMGGRADSRVIADGDSKSVVEAVFDNPPSFLEQFFVRNDIDWSADEILIRREIAVNGRSRVFVNDVPVTLTVLSAIAVHLIDIHSQHENARLVNPDAQLEIVDSVSDNEELRAKYTATFGRFVEIRNKVKRLRAEIEKNRENRNHLFYQYDGLKEFNPKRGELKELERKFELLSDADEIREKLQLIRGVLGENERGAIDLVRMARSETERMNLSLVGMRQDENAPGLPERLENIVIELQDIYETVDDALSGVESDPAALEKISFRMNNYYNAMKHYNVASGDGLVDLMEQLKIQLDTIDTGGEELPELEKEGKRLAGEVKELGKRLTETRLAGALKFSQAVTEAARPLGLPNLNFQVSVEPAKLGPNGQDKVEFLGAFNKNQTPSSLTGMASGGEMSRLMLTIKGVLAGRLNLPTIIFDEVDTGVSGEIADKMGEMMRSMSKDMQVMAITHLPQVAAKGNRHYKVYKRDEESRTVTRVSELKGDERVREIAGMMSGSTVGEAALNNARILLGEGS
ncbi:MAG: DNA repair protein RecN [Muribaculaceae bacterium]|nr:DNA repair protein RecN [Muribaculaceae bacterium]